MNIRSLGSLANLAKILEEAADPNSALREDRKETKAKQTGKKVERAKVERVIDPKRKAWYDKRLREQAQRPAEVLTESVSVSVPQEPLLQPGAARAAATKVGGVSLLQSLSKAKSGDKQAASGKRPEAWRRKPGDPIF